MAGEWLKMRTNLHKNPKVIGLIRHLAASREFAGWAESLGFALFSGRPVTPAVTDPVTARNAPPLRNVTPVTGCYGPLRPVTEALTTLARSVVAGALLRVWGAANEFSRDGLLVGIDLGGLDEIAEIPGVGAALVAVGWVVDTAEGVCLPNFGEWNVCADSRGAGKTNAQRQREFRERRRKEEQERKEAESVKAVTDSNGPVTARNVTVTAEKRREEKETVASQPLADADATAEKSSQPGLFASEPESQLKPSVSDSRAETGEKPTKPVRKRQGATNRNPEERKPRERNPVFDALAEITGTDPVVSGSHLGKLSALLGRASPPYTADDVREFGRRFVDLCPWADGRLPTLGEVEKYIGKIRAEQPAPRNGGGRGKTGFLSDREQAVFDAYLDAELSE